MIIEPLPAHPTETDISELKALMSDCIHGGASIGFLLESSDEELAAYWKKVIDEASQAKNRVIFIAREERGGPIVGSAQLACETRANGRHRAEVQKLMVLRHNRGKGVASLLMRELENNARARGVKLLFLDTSEGAGGAKYFYELQGYIYAGGIPGFALDPDGKSAQNAIYFKELPPVERPDDTEDDGKPVDYFLTPMNEAHWPEVARIYEEGIATGHATFASQAPATWAEFAKSKIAGCSFVCIDNIEGNVLGWVALSPTSSRAVYAGVAEVSLYVAPEQRGRGVGGALMAQVIKASESGGIWTLQSGTFPENRASIALQQRYGFRVLGRRERVALMNHGPFAGRWRDTLVLERRSAVAGI